MNTETTVKTPSIAACVRLEAASALKSIDAKRAAWLEHRSTIKVLSGLPKTPTGRVKKHVLEATVKADDAYAVVDGAAEYAIKRLCVALRGALILSNAVTASREAVERSLMADGFMPAESIRDDLSASYDLILEHNKTASRKDAVYCERVRKGDIVACNNSDGSMLVVSFEKYTNLYFVTFAGKLEFVRDERFGSYIPTSARDFIDFSRFSYLGSGRVHLSVVGSDDDCIARLGRMRGILIATSNLRRNAPFVRPDCDYLSSLDYARYVDDGHPDEPNERYNDIAALASGADLVLCEFKDKDGAAPSTKLVVVATVTPSLVGVRILSVINRWRFLEPGVRD